MDSRISGDEKTRCLAVSSSIVDWPNFSAICPYEFLML